MANEGVKAREPKASCIRRLCEPKNVIKVKRIKCI